MTNPTIDLCVIGGGLAGMSAALRASELGLKAVVLEQSADEHYLCNSRMSSCVFHLATTNVLSPPEELERAVNSATKNTAHPGLVKALAGNAERAVRWLQGQGVRFIRGSPAPYHNFVVAPPATHKEGPFDIEGRGGDVLLRTVEAALVKAGGEVRRGVSARSLIVEGGRCIGVNAVAKGQEQRIAARAVVIADGGFQANRELLRESGISPDPSRMVQRNAGSGRGEGLRMAVAAGARTSNMLGFYGHVMCSDALAIDKLWPYPWLDLVAGAGIVVGPDGRRFTDESRGGVYLANRIAALPDPASAVVIFDAAIWDSAGKAFMNPPNPRLTDNGGTLVTADTIEELAARLGLPEQALAEQVRAHNVALRSGELDLLSPPRSKGPLAPMPIGQAPFHAVRVTAGITHTMGGIAIDEYARTSRADGSVFDGLYAAGSATGGVEGGEHAGYVGGLVKACVTGLLAAEHAASQTKASA
jgi:fumarate reductase flavoprotein subunit